MSEEQENYVVEESLKDSIDVEVIEASKFKELSEIDVRPFVSKLTHGGRDFSYLPWAVALKILYLNDSGATWAVDWFDELIFSKDQDSVIATRKVPFLSSSAGCFVSTRVTSMGVEKKSLLPILDQKNQPMYTVASTHVNKAIMRCLVKNIALFGIGLDIFMKDTFMDMDANKNKWEKAASKDTPDHKKLRDGIVTAINVKSFPLPDLLKITAYLYRERDIMKLTLAQLEELKSKIDAKTSEELIEYARKLK